jgi:NAD(P)-dependent dehydrogenase (short-subunit alcohol dehydrogenase family)
MENKLFDLSNKVSVITGGNGGIGLGIAEGLASSGASLAILGRNEEKNKLSKDLLDRYGTKIETYKIDVSEENQVKEITNLLKKFKGKKNIVFELLDRKTRSFITLNSRSHQAGVSNELFENLKNLDGYLGFSINKSLMERYIHENVEEQIVSEIH